MPPSNFRSSAALFFSGSFRSQLFRTLKLRVSDFVGVRILRCQNLVGMGFIAGRPFFVNVGEF
jgi:hypothetical protein